MISYRGKMFTCEMHNVVKMNRCPLSKLLHKIKGGFHLMEWSDFHILLLIGGLYFSLSRLTLFTEMHNRAHRKWYWSSKAKRSSCARKGFRCSYEIWIFLPKKMKKRFGFRLDSSFKRIIIKENYSPYKLKMINLAIK